MSPPPPPAGSRRPGGPSGERASRRTWRWRTGIWLLILLVLGTWLLARALGPPPAWTVRVPYSPFFVAQLRAHNIDSVSTRGSTVEGTFRRAVRYPPDDPSAPARRYFKTEIPTFADTAALMRLLERTDVEVTAKPEADSGSGVTSILVGLLPLLFIGGALVFLMRGAGGGGMGAMSSFGRSRARRTEPSSQLVTFEDVAGIDEAKDELWEIVDFLRDPDKYRRLGGRIPHGVLLTGPPGTGKTLLARALAGEAKVPFFSISASEFVEMFVGVGASRVRDLFKEAKEAAPAIIFIDELDAIGRTRGPASGYGGNHDEREQTLNQILTEMDGFDPSIGVIVLSATNRPEVIDRALLRPGRSTGASPSSPRTRSVGAASSASTRARCRSPRTSIWTGSPRRHRAWWVPTSPTSSTRRRSWRPAAATTPSPPPTSCRRSRRSSSAPSAGSCSRRPSASGRPTTRPVTRSRPCSRPAPTRCEGVDHPARPGARRDAVGA